MVLRDYTFGSYDMLVRSLIDARYNFLRFDEYIMRSYIPERCVIMRHDVDRRPQNADHMSLMEQQMGVRATYYFRIVPESFDEDIIRNIYIRGHEVGYHYEDLCLANGDINEAYKLYRKHLACFRAFGTRTVCMHGSPRHKWDNRSIWDRYDYRIYGVVGEPYFDIDFEDVLYISDSGRTWNNNRSIIRDCVDSSYNVSFRSTYELADHIQQNRLPNRILINTHPERWNDDLDVWMAQLLGQTLRNGAKYVLNTGRSLRQRQKL